MGERFHCPRCGYTRPLVTGEDGFRLFLVHEQRCSPTAGEQLWLPFITEDALDWTRPEERMVRLRRFVLTQKRVSTEDMADSSSPSPWPDARKAA
jgi:hypothetical protein